MQIKSNESAVLDHITQEKKEILPKKKLFIFDQDGTIYLNFKPLNGSKKFLKYLINENKKIAFISNNSSISSSTYVHKLRNILDLNITKNQIYTSTLSTIHYLKKKNIKKIYCLGTKEFVNEILENGFVFSKKNPEIIIIAFDKSLTYEKLKIASLLIQKGISYIATHPDIVCPTNEGFIPDVGSFIALMKKATGKKPVEILGKPNPSLINSLLSNYEISKDNAIIFGDRLYTDIKMGIDCDISTALVLTGETKKEDLINNKIKPDFVFNDLEEAYQLIKNLGSKKL